MVAMMVPLLLRPQTHRPSPLRQHKSLSRCCAPYREMSSTPMDRRKKDNVDGSRCNSPFSVTLFSPAFIFLPLEARFLIRIFILFMYHSSYCFNPHAKVRYRHKCYPPFVSITFSCVGARGRMAVCPDCYGSVSPGHNLRQSPTGIVRQIRDMHIACQGICSSFLWAGIDQGGSCGSMLYGDENASVYVRHTLVFCCNER